MRPISSTRLRPGPRLLDCSGASDVSSGWGCSSAGAGVAGSSPAAGCALSGWSWTVAPSSPVSVVFFVRAIFVSSLIGGFDGHAISELGPGTYGSPGGLGGTETPHATSPARGREYSPGEPPTAGRWGVGHSATAAQPAGSRAPAGGLRQSSSPNAGPRQ